MLSKKELYDFGVRRCLPGEGYKVSERFVKDLVDIIASMEKRIKKLEIAVADKK